MLKKIEHLLIALPCLLFLGCSTSNDSALERILAEGSVYMGTSMSPTTYYLDGEFPQGLEYEMAQSFANYLGVELEIILHDNPDELFSLLEDEKIDFAIGTLRSTEREDLFNYGPSYHHVSQNLVYRKGGYRPSNISETNVGLLVVQAGSTQAELLETLSEEFPELKYQVTRELDKQQLVDKVMAGEINYTILESTLIALTRRFKPKLSIALKLTEPTPLAWAYKKREYDDSIQAALLDFFANLVQSGELNELLDKYYGHVEQFDYVDSVTFIRAYRKKFPRYQDIFEQAAYANNMDWRLLAAIGYQESHWNPLAKSPTGVRGIMMLTLDTTRDLGLTSRLDPKQAIPGGAEHFMKMYRRIPDEIVEPDRTWIALAAYNIGYGHIQDAMEITKRRDMNPHKWVDLAENLPLLTKKKWYKTVRYGYARGYEPVKYVKNIRRYYETLTWLTEHGEELEWGFDDASHHNKYKDTNQKPIFPFLDNFNLKN